MNFSCRSLYKGLVVLISLCMPSVAAGSTGQKLSIDRLSAESEIIIKGRVDELKSRQARDRSFAITSIVVSVERQFKGPAVSAVTIEQPGGSIGDITQATPGLAQFSPGEEVILFLERRGRNMFHVVGGRQGKFTIKSGPSGTQKFVEDYAGRTEALDSFLSRISPPERR